MRAPASRGGRCGFDSPGEITEDGMKGAMRQWGRNGRGLLAGAGIAFLSATVQAAESLPVRETGWRITAESLELHQFVMYAVLAIFCAVFAVMLLSMHAHRKAAARAAGPFHRSAAVELAWAAIPWVILFGLAWPATRVLAEVESPSRADITIKATGLQWKWAYRYLEGDGEGVAFYSNIHAPRTLGAGSAGTGSGGGPLDVDNPVVVPVGRRIRMVLEANEDIHSWHVPALGVKEYAVPGLVRDTWFHARRTGTYRGLCSAEACGAGRACVLVVVKVVSDDEFRRWIDGRRTDLASPSNEASPPPRLSGRNTPPA